MSQLQHLLDTNRRFVENKRYGPLLTSKFPDRKIAILSCMDTRLTELLPASMNIKNGEAIIIKNAGAVISHPFGSIMRSLLIAVYDLGVEEIVVIAHDDCGMQQLEAGPFIEKMKARGIAPSRLDMIRYFGVDLRKWLEGFKDPESAVLETVDSVRNHPLMPEGVQVHGFIMDSKTGELARIAGS